MGKLFDIIGEAYLFAGLIEPDPEPVVYICDICDEEFIEGRRVTFKTYVENVCEDCYSDPNYLDIPTRKNIKKIERLG